MFRSFIIYIFVLLRIVVKIIQNIKYFPYLFSFYSNKLNTEAILVFSMSVFVLIYVQVFLL